MLQQQTQEGIIREKEVWSACQTDTEIDQTLKTWKTVLQVLFRVHGVAEI